MKMNMIFTHANIDAAIIEEALDEAMNESNFCIVTKNRKISDTNTDRTVIEFDTVDDDFSDVDYDLFDCLVESFVNFEYSIRCALNADYDDLLDVVNFDINYLDRQAA